MSVAAGAYDKRLGKVETELARLDATMGGVQRDVAELKQATGQVLAGIHELRHREASRPQPFSWRVAIGTAGSVAALVAVLATISWWFTSVSPPILALDKRLTKIDDPEIGRMPRAEKRLEDLERWRPTVVRH